MTTTKIKRRCADAVLAANLVATMEERGLTQESLAKLSGLSQSSISNYLNPNRRNAGKSGMVPSAKLSGVQMIADALGLDAWELLRSDVEVTA